MKATLALVHDSGASPLTPDKLAEHDGEPRIRDVDLGERLGFAKPATVRDLIDRNIGELRTYGSVSVTVTETTAKGGRPGKVSWLNEGQALVLCALSRTPRAAALRKQLINVFQAYRAGRLAPAAPAVAASESSALDALRADARALAEAAAALIARVDAAERDAAAAATKAAKRLAAPAAPTLAPEKDGAMLLGIVAIAAHLGITPRQAKYRVDTDVLPHFKMGRAVCSSRDALDAFGTKSFPAGEARA